MSVHNLITGQDYVKNFGKFNVDEVKMTSYHLDKDAEAVVLYDLGNAYFLRDDVSGFEIVFERRTKIKILSKAGLDYANVVIPFYYDDEKMEKVYEIEGYTYNIENGMAKISKFDEKNVFQEKVSEHWLEKKFAMPDIKEGSVLEYRYKIISPFIVNFRDWEFQYRIPAVYSEYTVRMIPFYDYTYILQGASKFDYFLNKVDDNLKQRFQGMEYNDNNFTFGMKDVAAFRDESFISSISDYIMKLDFQLSAIHRADGSNEEYMTTWPMLIHEFLKYPDFGTYIKSASKNTEDVVNGMALSSESTSEKTEAIFNYVKSNFNWNGYKNRFTSQSARDFMRSKTGNSADINLFLCGMLNAADIEAFPVILSTRDHGRIYEKYPFHHVFNYIIVLVRTDDRDILLDATEPLSYVGILPTRCINEKGLVINKEKVEWISLADSVDSELTDSIYYSFCPTLDTAFLDVHRESIGHIALESRREYLSDPESFMKKVFKNGMDPKGEARSLNSSEAELPFIYEYSAAMQVESVENKLLLAPFPGLAIPENQLKLPFRSYPVDMIYKRKHSFITVIDVPAGYNCMDQSKSVSINNDLVNIEYQIESTLGMLKVKGSYEFKKPVYLKYEYFDLRKYMTRIVEIFNSKIVLEKI